MELSPRLKAIADLVPDGAKVADIGTDHGYLLIYLIRNNKVITAIGGDLNQGPYLSALKSVKEAGVAHQVEIRLGNGLEVIRPGEADVLTIAGMGGTTIIEILQAKPKVLKEVKRLILQPMIGSEQLRRWLLENKWPIIDEELVKDDGRIYEIIVAVNCDNNEDRAITSSYQDFLYLVSPFLLSGNDPLLRQHVEKLIKGDEKVLYQLNKSNLPEVIEKQKIFKERIQLLRGILCQLNSKP